VVINAACSIPVFLVERLKKIEKNLLVKLFQQDRRAPVPLILEVIVAVHAIGLDSYYNDL
jgi:hypothetical protein